MDPLEDKFSSFGWDVYSVDGHSHPDLNAAFRAANNVLDAPSVVIANTIKGKGVSFMENNNLWHYRTAQGDEYENAKKELMK